VNGNDEGALIPAGTAERLRLCQVVVESWLRWRRILELGYAFGTDPPTCTALVDDESINT
jgi:hypothetical protein